jgi:hypothetical protein
MRSTKYLGSLALAILAITGNRASSQANVVENQSTYLYVDAQNGADTNSGVQSAPFKTIQAAVNKANADNQIGIGTKVMIAAGVYREFVNIGNYKSTSATLTLQAAVAGTAVIAGSNILTGWTQQTSTIYDTAWNYNLGYCAIPSGWPTDFAPIVQRAEMVVVNGTPLTQVMAFNDLRPGTFYVSDTYSLMHVDPPAGTDMATAVVEAAVRRQTLSVAGRTNVVLRGLSFRHAANCFNASSASVSASTNVLVDSVQSLWNNWGGLGVFSSNYVTVQNSIGSYNGGQGIMGDRDQNILFSSNESDYNNWRGALGAFYDWAMGGTKLFAMRTTTVQNQFAYNNQAEGLWFDTDNKDITISNSTLSGNLKAALQIERNEGPISMKNSVLCSSGQGINVLTSTNLTIQDNTFYNNSGTNKDQGEIYIAGQSGGIVISDWQTGQSYDLFTTGMVLTGNTFENASSGQLVFGTYLDASDWSQFASTLNSSSNTWYDPSTTSSFKVVNGKVVGLAAWQSAVQTDYSSTWQQPATSPVAACSAPAPSYKDFAVSVDNNAYTMSAGSAVATVRINSFAYGPVALKVEGMPSGVTASLSQNNLTSGALSLTINSTTAATAQKVPITLFATSGSRVHSVTFDVQVYPL